MTTSSRTPKFEVWKNAAGEWQWHLRAGNGEIQAAGEGYKTEYGAKRGIDACRRNAARAIVGPATIKATQGRE